MSPPPGRPKAGSLPPGGTARSAKGAHEDAPPGRPKAGSLPPGGTARSAKGAHEDAPPGRPKAGSPAPKVAEECLRLSGVQAYYGESHILHGVDLTVKRGEVVTLLGRNGAGRTTTLKAILGLVGRRTGSIMINGTESVKMAPHQVARQGIGYCPEERGIFASLTCEENLQLPPALLNGGMDLEEIYRLFPNLYERRASPGTRLSGGEQQMLAVARILRTGARLLLLDEISEGLAPVIMQTLARTVRMLREKGFTIVMVEQNFRFAAPLANQFYVMEHGRIVEGFVAGELQGKMDMLHEYLGI